MDVNGTMYHLLYECDDWSQCLLVDGGTGKDETLQELWRARSELSQQSDQSSSPTPLEWDCGSASLRLSREVPLFRPLKGKEPLSLRTRRGAGCDRYGNWYWIDDNESGIRFLPAGEYTSVPFWNSADRAKECDPSDAAFAACLPPRPSSLVLRGLAVTKRHFLVVGDVTEHGLLVFDLHQGGSPLFLRWPAADFTPWDLAPTSDGGVLVLDRDHKTYWRLDENFRVPAGLVGEDTLFQPADSASHNVRTQTHPQGYVLASVRFPVSIESVPDGHVLILDGDPAQDALAEPAGVESGSASSTALVDRYSTIYEYDGANLLASYSLQKVVPAIDSTGKEEKFSVLGHDFAYFESSANTLTSGLVMQKPGCECKQGATPSQHVVYVADQGGKQAFALVLDHTDPKQWTVIGQPDFLPMRRWDGKAVVAVNGQVYYDFLDRWVPLHVFTECHYARQAVLTTPTQFGKVPGGPFDSKIPGCAWHRLFLDAQIPQSTEILIRARAADDPDLLLQTSWSQQPALYLRSGGAELPYFDPWADIQPLPERTGTWELLFQEISGRYLQIELTIGGTGRSTPAIRALRAWYPRFSYLDNYMPAVYREDPVSASFLERWLANFEGFYTNLEDKIEHVAELFDPRTAPAEALDWLAGWFGLLLDPLWSRERQRFLIGHLDELYRWRGTVAGIEIAIRLYVDDSLDESLFDFSSLRKSKVRIVERFSLRGAGGYAYDAPTSAGVRPLIPLTPEIVQRDAHRFSVLLPGDLSAEQIGMVQRIVTREKPAHTEFEISPYGSFFRVGEARLGLDTQLGESRRFVAMLLGSASLAQSYLGAPYPFDIADRMVLDRDRLGNLPAL